MKLLKQIKRKTWEIYKAIRAIFSIAIGKYIERSFDVNKYGYENALKMANDVLDEKQKEK